MDRKTRSNNFDDQCDKTKQYRKRYCMVQAIAYHQKLVNVYVIYTIHVTISFIPSNYRRKRICIKAFSPLCFAMIFLHFHCFDWIPQSPEMKLIELRELCVCKYPILPANPVLVFHFGKTGGCYDEPSVFKFRIRLRLPDGFIS
jgi:hypothetical protein